MLVLLRELNSHRRSLLAERAAESGECMGMVDPGSSRTVTRPETLGNLQ